LEAEQAKAGRVAHFAAELNETVLEDDGDIHELLAEVDEATAEALLNKFKALSSQINESSLTGDVGSAGDPESSDPHDALDVAIKAIAAERELSYQDAMNVATQESPELFAHLKGIR
jgi:hypothetical protein